MEQKQTIKLSGIVRNLPDNTVPDGTMHELINLRPRDGALRPVGQKTPTVIVARDIRHIHRVSNSIIVYIGSSEDGGTLSYWVSVNGTLGSEVTTDIIIPGNGAPVKFANLKNTVMVSCHTIEQLALMVFDEDANTYTIFDSIDRFFPRDIPNFNVQRVAVAADNDTNTFEAPYTVNLNDALMAEYVKMQRSREDKGYLSGKVLIRFAWELFDGTMVKHTVPDLTRTSDLEVTYSTESSLFNNEGGWEISTAFTAYKLQFYLAGDSGWLTAFQDKYKNIIRSLKIYVSRPKSPDEDITKDERFEKIIKDNDGLVGKMLNKIERIFDLAELKDYSPNPETEQYYLLREIKISDLTASTWTDIIDTTEEDISVQNLSTREQLTVDNFTHHQLFANRLFTYNERIFLADIKNTLLQGFPVVGLFSSWSTVTGANYEVAMEYEIIVTGNKTLRTISAWTTLNYYSNASPLALEFSIRRSYVPGGGMLGEYGYFGYPDARATKVRVLVRQNNVTYIAAERELKSYPGQNYSIVKGFEVSSPLYAMTSYTPSYVPSSWSYYDTNRVQATELNNPFYFPAINSYRLGLGQVLGMATNAIALSQGQYGQFPVFVFCSDGIYAMNIGTGETLINTISPLSREVCSNPESITPIDAGAAFVSARGLFVIAGTAKPELSEAAEGKHTSRITALAAYDSVSNDANYYQIKSLLCQIDFLTYLANAVIGYDYQHNEIIVSNIAYPYSWVFSIDNKLWFKISESFRRFVNDYPVCYGIKEEEEITTTTPAPTTTEGPVTTEPPLTTEAPTTTNPPTTTEAPTTTETPTTTEAPNIFFSDWFLPSQEELRAMLAVVDTTGEHGYTAFLSSSEGIEAWAGTAIGVYNYGAYSIGYFNKDTPMKYFACRAFISFTNYSVGDTGPAGGTIFYKNGNDYLEATPSAYIAEEIWSNINTAEILGTGTAIGTGLDNSRLITEQTGHTTSAAQDCLDIVINI